MGVGRTTPPLPPLHGVIMRTTSSFALVPVLLLAAAPAIAAQSHQEEKLVTLYADDGDAFGASVSTFGDRALVGAPAADDAGPNSGAAYVFARDAAGDWSEEATLFADIGPEHLFGHAVALFGDRALVGAPGADDAGIASGAVHVFERASSGAWIERARLVASDADAQDYFGWAVALFGDRALIGARDDDDSGHDAGSAYVFERTPEGTWQQTAKLVVAELGYEDRFGVAVSLFGDRAVVAAPGEAATYVFERDVNGDWLQTAKLVASGGHHVSLFGSRLATAGDGACYVFELDQHGTWAAVAEFPAAYVESVSILGGRLLVGRPAPAFSQVAADLYERTDAGEWSFVTTLLPADSEHDNGFGSGVSLSPGRAFVGAKYDTVTASACGSCFEFAQNEQGAWNETSWLAASDAAYGDNLGHSVSCSSDYVLVGAYRDDTPGLDSGSAYVFRAGVGATTCASKVNSTGASAALSVVGSASVAANDMTLSAWPTPASATGIFFFGPDPAEQPFGNGLRCLGGSILRLSPVVAKHHVLSRKIDLAAPPLAGNVLPGSTWYAQAWFRDVPAGGALFNTSSGLVLTFVN